MPTVDNIELYHDPNNFEPRFQRPMVLPGQLNGMWNPLGTGSFRLVGCTVTSLVRADGSTGADDPLIGGQVTEDDARVSAKLVDLDVNDQQVSMIFGLRVRLVDAAGAELFRGDFEPAAFDDLWSRFDPGRPGDLSAAYQSVLTNVVWAEETTHAPLAELREASAAGLLSVKFTTDRAEIDPSSPRITYGRVIGAIGPAGPDEPRHFVASRRLRRQAGGTFNHAPCRVDTTSGVVSVDLANSLPVATSGGPVASVGPLHLAVLPPDGVPRRVAALGTVDEEFLESRAGIADVRLTAEQVAAVVSTRIAVVDSAARPVVLLAENADATMLRADDPVFRLHPGGAEATASTTLHATRLGSPAAGVEITLGGADETPGLDHPHLLTTDVRGRAEVTLVGGDPGPPGPFGDGRTFSVPYGPVGSPVEGRLHVLVTELYQAPEHPTWVADVQPIFQRYANLYPAMRKVLDLSNHHDVVRYRDAIKYALSLPVAHPNHMPVTRALSPAKRDMVLRWLDSGPVPAVLRIDTPEALRSALQQALLVEQAVIPPYLCALFSLKPNRNVEVAEIIRGVVRQEMLHMALVGNLLNAVGGRPRIGRPGFVPVYPGRLPGPVLPDLEVRLRRCSVEHIRDVFLAIEQPEHPIVDGRRFTGAVLDRSRIEVADTGELLAASEAELDGLAAWFDKAEYPTMTIGWFYNQLARAVIGLDRELAQQGGTLFAGDPARQVSWPGAPGTLFRVTDRHTALLAIHEIIEQGEGSPHELDADTRPASGELGHYYRFKEIVEGRRLVRDHEGRWVYEGAPVRFDPDDVHPMVDDPDASLLQDGSRAKAQADVVNATYTKMLTGLDRIFDGNPQELADVQGLMYSLEVEAGKLLELPSGLEPGTVAGPAFQSSAVPW
ncbi:ferritin-like domain-containing protein [Umezawaea tangerina]|uniref:ferritin-like domain-containing protein n=1 Tax=Umezawaea tangerina TaxID=84725 RepID=UPI000AB30D1C|nr:ferritin-like protein [Umezawaea tangerina]